MFQVESKGFGALGVWGGCRVSKSVASSGESLHIPSPVQSSSGAYEA